MYKLNIWKIFGFYSLYSLISIVLFGITSGEISHSIVLAESIGGFLFCGLLLLIVFIIKTIKKENDLFIPIKFFKNYAIIIICLQLFLILFNISYYSDIFSFNFLQLLISRFSLSNYAIPIVPTHIVSLLCFLFCFYLGSFFGFLIKCPNNENGEIILRKKKFDEEAQRKYIRVFKISIIFIGFVTLFYVFFESRYIRAPLKTKFVN